MMAIQNIERYGNGCRTFLLIAGVVLVPAIFHTLLPPCDPYITIHFMEMIFSTLIIQMRVNESGKREAQNEGERRAKNTRYK